MSFFKSVIAYRIGPNWTPPALEVLEAELSRLAFEPCGPTQEVSVGWMPPRGEEHGAMVENVAGHLIVKLAVERKSVPASAVKQELDARVKALEAERGRKPGKKEKAEIKDEIMRDLMPRAFSKRSAHFAWIDPVNRFLVVGAGSYKAADAVVTHLVDLMAELKVVLPLAPIQTTMTAGASMGTWLATKESPPEFSIDQDLKLKNEDRATISYTKHNLDLDEITHHLESGMAATQMALTWEGKVSFVLTDTMVVRKINFLDVTTDVGADDGFDGDVMIATGELSKLLPDLLRALGGEQVQGVAADAGAAATA